jgi:hypothetical protein
LPIRDKPDQVRVRDRSLIEGGRPVLIDAGNELEGLMSHDYPRDGVATVAGDCEDQPEESNFLRASSTMALFKRA